MAALAGAPRCALAMLRVKTAPPLHCLHRAVHSAAAKPVVSISKSRFKEKRGQQHGSPFLQVKGQLSPARLVPASIVRPPYAINGQVPYYPEPEIHDTVGRDRMRKACAVAAQVLASAGELAVRAGVTTDSIDQFVHNETIRLGAYPSPLGYMGFPKSVCASINEVVCHGIPDSTVLREGDIVKLDVSCYIGGVHGDTCRTFVVGGMSATDDTGRHLITSTKAMLDSSIKLCGPGVPINAVGAHIGEACERERLDNVDAFSGHGVGSIFHTNPIVHHRPNTVKYVMKPGMTFTIEPMIVEGSGDVDIWPDGWTVVTKDRGRAAQFEHTLLVTEHGVEVLTRALPGAGLGCGRATD